MSVELNTRLFDARLLAARLRNAEFLVTKYCYNYIFKAI